MHTTIRFLALVVPLATCFLPPQVALASEPTLYQEEVVTLKGVKKVVMDIAVAELRIKQHAESDLSLRAELKVKEVDVPLLDRKPAELKVSVERDGEVVRLKLTKKLVRALLDVALPSGQALAIEVSQGVGSINAELPLGASAFSLGVGDIKLKGRRAHLGPITAQVGVGDINVSGLSTEPSRALVSSSLQANGDGSHPLAAQIGVGSLSLRLEP